MRKLFIFLLLPALMLGGCGTTNTGMGVNPGAVMAGASLGGNLGGAIGGIVGSNNGGWNGGWRGSAIGAIVGTIAGAAIGSAVSSSVARQQQEQMNRQPQDVDDGYNQSQYVTMSNVLDVLHIENIRFIDDNRNRVINPNESCKIVFDIYNDGNETAYNIIPVVQDLSDLKAISISPSVMIERILPGAGYRYTATLYADKKLKSGMVNIRVAVTNEHGVMGDWQEFTLQAVKE